MPPMDSSAYPLFDPGSWPFISANCPDFLDVKTEDGSFCSGPLVGSAISSSNGESCMSKVEKVVGQRSMNNFSSGPGLSPFARGNPIVSDSLMHGGLDYVAPSECASSTASSAQRVDSGELPSVYTDELASVFSNVTSVQRGDSCLIELASAFPTGEALSDPPPNSCATTAVGAIPVTRTDDQQPQMSGMTGIGGTSHSMPVLNAVLPTIVADKSRQSITVADHISGSMLFKVPFAGIGMPAGENSRPKRRNVKISKDPQSVAARHRRERISDRISTLKKLVPGGTKMDTASMLDEAINYVKYLKAQVQTMETVNVASNCFQPYGSGPFYHNNMAGLGETENFAMGCRGRTMQSIGSGLNYPL